MMKNGLKFKQGELGHFITFQKQFFNNQLALKASNDMDLAKPSFSPSFGFTSRQLNQYILQGGVKGDGSFNFSLSKEESPTSRFGYQI